MKTKRRIPFSQAFIILWMAFFTLVTLSQAQETFVENTAKERTGEILIKPVIKNKKSPTLYKAEVKQRIDIVNESLVQKADILITRVQGDSKKVSLELSAKPKNMILTKSGPNYQSWALREDSGRYYLDIVVKDAKFDTLNVSFRNTADWKIGELSVMTFGADAKKRNVSFSEKVEIVAHAGVKMDIVVAEGFSEMKHIEGLDAVLLSNKASKLRLNLNKGYHSNIDLRNVSLNAVLAEDGKSALVTLNGDLNVRSVKQKSDELERFLLLQGRMAIVDFSEVEGVELKAARLGHETLYQLVPQQVGEFPISAQFALDVGDDSGWNFLDFVMPNGAVVPIHLSGMKDAVEFNTDNTALTILNQSEFDSSQWSGVVPATGKCLIKWKNSRRVGDGELFFTSEGTADISIGAGLLETTEKLSFKILQGKMNKIVFDLTGEGEVLSVVGKNIVSWKVDEVAGKKALTCVFSSDRSEIGDILVKSQSPLGKFPAKIVPLTVTARAAMRHSGYVKITNKGAVRIEASKTDGLLQLAPNQYPASDAERKQMEQARQLFIYRYPSADRGLEIAADQIIPEVSVSHISVYELGETDRVIYSDIEVDIREAGLREWSFRIPAEYAVSEVQCAAMADHVVSTTVENGTRMLKVIFHQEVMGRQLVQVKLEKNQAAQAGEWTLPKLSFTGVKSVRGDIGVQVEHGWRVNPVKITGLTDRALAYFPKKSDKLQQSYRSRDDLWSAAFTVSPLGQSIQAELFHLYNLKESTLEAKILVNYFVVGAPASKWELAIPTTAENVAVEGQNVRSWEVNDHKIVVDLHQPALGVATLLVTYEEAMSSNQGDIVLGGVAPVNVQSEAGFIHLVSNSQVTHHQLEQTKGLHSISPLEMPSEFQALSSQPSVAAWQYANRPYNLKLNVETPELVETIDQVVGAATLDTKITSTGEVVTIAKFLVNTRGKKALRISLPEGNELWSAKADKDLINARVDGGQYILPLPPTDDPNRFRQVVIRYGGVSADPETVVVGPPVLSAPMTIAEWKVSGDNHLAVTGGNVKPLQSVVQKTGFDWIRDEYVSFIAILLFLIGGIFFTCCKVSNKWLEMIGTAWLIIAMICSVCYALNAMDFSVVSLKEFNVVAPVVGQQEIVTLELANHVEGVSTSSGFGILLMLIGIVVIVASQLNKLPKVLGIVGIFALSLGSLYHIGGAFYLYTIVALIAFMMLIQCFRTMNWKQWKPKKMRLKKKAKKAVTTTVATLIALTGMIATTQDVSADEKKPVYRALDHIADHIVESWKIEDEQLAGTMKVTWQGKKDAAITVLTEPATLTGNQGEGYRVIKMQNPHSKRWIWKLVAEVDGELTANISYTMSVKDIADQRWRVPSSLAVMKSLRVELDQADWQISSSQAVRTEKLNLAGKSAVDMAMLGASPAYIAIVPKPRDRASEELRFFVEMADIYLPSAGVLDGRHIINVRPLSGEVETLTLKIPSELLVGDVVSPGLDSWRFDAVKKELVLTMQSPQTDEFSLMIVTQKGIKAFPQDLVIEPIEVVDAENVVGMLGYGFGAESQPDNDKVNGLLEVNIADFNKQLLRDAKQLQPSFVLHKAYRYGNDRGNVELRVASVAPEIRVESKQVIRLTDESMSLQIEAEAEITRSGVFELKFEVPESFTVESVNGPALREWTESTLEGQRLVTMFLNGKTIGKQRFVITMVSENVAEMMASSDTDESSNWEVPKWSFLGVDRQKGTMAIVPDQGIRLVVLKRKNASELNSKEQDGSQKNTLQFRLLQNDWELGLSVQKLEAWVTAELLQELTLKESITRKRVSIMYNVENSVVKDFKIRLPNVSKDQAQTVRASGDNVKEIVHLEGDIWQVVMKQAVIGKVPVVIAYDDSSSRKGSEDQIQPVNLVDVEQTNHYVVVRSPGRLDIQAQSGSKKQGWRSFDWNSVPKYLHDATDRSVPSLSYRVMNTTQPLKVSVKRHAMAGTLKLRVENGTMRTLLSSNGSSLSRLSVDVRVIEESSLRVTLPTGAELFNVMVNDESVAVVRDGDEYRFIVAKATQENEASKVKVTYRLDGAKQTGDVRLLGPSLNVPLEKIDWFVMIPDGYDFSVSNQGGFDYKELLELGSQNYMHNYTSNVKTRFERLKRIGEQELQQAMTWSHEGQLDKANAAFSRVTYNYAVDQASNEDAKVKLERNMTSQAIMGLNTRRQIMYLDNKKAGNAVQNGALELAASSNPYLYGDQNFNPNDLDNYMKGNTQEEINAMSRIAKKIVGNDLNVTQAMQAIDIELLDTSRVVHFYRDIQLPGDNKPEIKLNIQATSLEGKKSNGLIVITLLVAAVAGALVSFCKPVKKN